MRTFLLATAAITLVGTGAWAIDDDSRQPRSRVANDHASSTKQDGTLIEVRGEDGERTLHMQGHGPDSTLNVNGRDIQIHDGHLTVDGQDIETDGQSVIIIDGDEIRIIGDNDADRYGGRFEFHTAERAEDMARMAAEMGQFRFEFDSEGMQDEVMASLEAALAGLERGELMDGDQQEWEDLSEADREAARASIEEAREDIRQAMEEMREEMREAQRAGRSENRRVRVELSGDARDAARAERDSLRAERDAAHDARDAARAERDAARGEARQARTERHSTAHWTIQTDDDARNDSNIRVERSDDGRRHVWVDGEEQTGDNLVDWLNQLEADRLASALTSRNQRHERRIVRLNGDDTDGREIELDGASVIVLRSDDDAAGERVFEFELETNDNQIDDKK